MYHQVAPSAPSAYFRYTVTPGLFAWQMRIPVALGYRTVSLATLLAARTSGSPLPKRRVAITFDDGFADAVRYATPILARRGFTATVFVVTGLLGTTSEWTGKRRGIEMPLAGTRALRDVAAAGFTVGGTPSLIARFADLDESECRSDLQDSKRRLEEALNCDVRDLVPVRIDQRESTGSCRRVRLQTACPTIEGLSSAADDPLMLRRVHITGVIHSRTSPADSEPGTRTGAWFSVFA